MSADPAARRHPSRRALPAVALAAGVLAVVVVVVLVVRGAGSRDPFAFSTDDAATFEREAAAGESHLLYTHSPGGAIATARRVNSLQGPVAAAAHAAHVDPALVEGVVFLESGGRPNAIVGGDPANAAGVAQILPDTGRSLLGMHVDLPASRRLTAEIAAAGKRHDGGLVSRLERERRRADERFDPPRALAATGRYLTFALPKFGRPDFAVASYHMGVGNLADAIRAYAGPKERRLAKKLVEDEDLSYAQLYFDSTPFTHKAAYQRLARLGDNSATYYWRVLAARDIMRLYRADSAELRRLDDLQRRAGSGEAVLHPPGATPVFGDQQAIRAARARGQLVAIPDSPAKRHVALAPEFEDQARRNGADPRLYAALRPEALATLYYLADRVHAISRARQPLLVAAAVRDVAYEAELDKHARARPGGYSLYTTGYSFDVERRYESPRQAQAFQAMLDRLQALNVIAWEARGKVIHVTVSRRAEALLPVS
jgi:hypothetical protein